MIVLWADFNVVDGDEVWTSMSNTPGVIFPEPSDTVVFQDESGERCWVFVTNVDGPIVYGKIMWETWESIDYDGPAGLATEVRGDMKFDASSAESVTIAA